MPPQESGAPSSYTKPLFIEFETAEQEHGFSIEHSLAGDDADRRQHELPDKKHEQNKSGCEPERGDPAAVSVKLELSNEPRQTYH